jgi:3-carboxy-cis,cis-muconate cycloisomerase
MRPSSSRSELFDGVLARGPVRGLVSDEAWLDALLTVEATLARVEADAGLVPASSAAAIVDACRPERFDVPALGAAAAESGNPVIPLVAALRDAVGPAAAPSVHYGATSQDILDSAAMLVAGRALDALVGDLDGAIAAATRLARTHRDTVMAGRTLLQQAVPVTFGLLAAGWLTGLASARARLVEVRRTRLAAQLGGPAGTLAGLGPDLPARFAAALGLAAPAVPWHTERTRIADLAGALGTAGGALAKVARDVTLLAQTEIGEVAEGRPGGSSSMAHKRNPIAAVSTLAATAQAPGLVATLLATMPQELQRAAGGWHAEWRPLRDLLVATGSAAAWLRDCLEQLVVHPDRMRANLPPGPVDAGCAGELVDRALS